MKSQKSHHGTAVRKVSMPENEQDSQNADLTERVGVNYWGACNSWNISKMKLSSSGRCLFKVFKRWVMSVG